MPEKAPPLYKWTVTAADCPGFTIEAAYPVIDSGHMLLKDPDHKIVFAGAPEAKCTFTRGALVAPSAAPLTVTAFPDGCCCTYSTWTGPAGAAWHWERKVSWGCKADHTEIDGVAAITAGSALAVAGRCPHNFPLTVRCHECTPVITDGARL